MRLRIYFHRCSWSSGQLSPRGGHPGLARCSLPALASRMYQMGSTHGLEETAHLRETRAWGLFHTSVCSSLAGRAPTHFPPTRASAGAVFSPQCPKAMGQLLVGLPSHMGTPQGRDMAVPFAHSCGSPPARARHTADARCGLSVDGRGSASPASALQSL